MKRMRLVGKQPLPINIGTGSCEGSSMGQVLQNLLASYLQVSELCSLDAASACWHNHKSLSIAWRNLYLSKRNLPAWELDGIELTWKLKYACHPLRIVPGERAAGIKLGSHKSEVKVRPCEGVTPRYNVEYLRYVCPGQGYHKIHFKWPVGPVSCPWEAKATTTCEFLVALENFDDVDSVTYDGTQFTGQALTIWHDANCIRAIGVHSPLFGQLEISNKPFLKDVRVGVQAQSILAMVGATNDDITISGSNPGGPIFGLPQLPNVVFELDAENGGKAEIDDFACYDNEDWVIPRLHYPISGIFIW